MKMSEQTKQSVEFSQRVYLGEWSVWDIGATTLADLCKDKIINKHTTDKKILRKKPDALIVSPDKEIIVYIESKDDGVLKSQKQRVRAYAQEIQAARKMKASIYVTRDSAQTNWYNPLTGNLILDEHGNPLLAELRPKTLSAESERLIKKILSSISDKNDQILKEEYMDPSDLARQIHQKLFITKAVSPSTALYTFVELFLFKYLSDLKVLNAKYSFEYLVGLYEGNKEIDVLRDYLQNARRRMEELFPRAEDGTSIINGNVFHEDVGDAETFHNIIRAFDKYEKEHGKFIYISKDFKSKLFESFLKQELDSKRMGQFFTPLAIVDAMVRMVDVKPGMHIGDPACGVGKFLLQAIGNDLSAYFKYNKSKKTMDAKITITGYDKYSEDNGDKTIILAKANTLIYFSKLLTENPSPDFAKALTDTVLNQCFELKKSTLGSLEKIETETYDLILANPPYVVNGSADIKKLADGYEWGGLGIESLFVEWIVKSLKQGGTANIVIPDGILSNMANETLKRKICEQCYVCSIISLPVRAFFNTSKKTYIITLEKKTADADGRFPRQDKPVFCYICLSIGEQLDTYRFPTDDNDLKDAVDNYNIWRNVDDPQMEALIEKRAKGRFKALDVAEFNPAKSWIIENWWSEEEKIVIGLKKEQKKQTVEDFIDLVSETEDLLHGIKGELECLK